MDEKELKDRLEKITPRLLPHVGMLLLLPSSGAPPSDVICNGTASFIDTGTAKLLVTCGHVIDRFNELREANPHAVLAVGAGNGVPPVIVSDAHLVENGGTRLDLAVLRLPDPERITGSGKSYFRAEVWPPIRAMEGQVAVLLGFPGAHRASSAGGLDARATPVCDFVTSVSARHIVLADGDMVRVAVKCNPDLDELTSLGGMSGSAVYVVDEARNIPQLVGFMYESGEGIHATIFVAHAAFLRADGALDHHAMPW
ncbi:MAG: hypothetical protein ACP5I8_01220 [Phycisphaerae bacterium]